MTGTCSRAGERGGVGSESLLALLGVSSGWEAAGMLILSTARTSKHSTSERGRVRTSCGDSKAETDKRCRDTGSPGSRRVALHGCGGPSSTLLHRRDHPVAFARGDRNEAVLAVDGDDDARLAIVACLPSASPRQTRVHCKICVHLLGYLLESRSPSNTASPSSSTSARSLFFPSHRTTLRPCT